jgi:aminobenzoyl-glutamate transport protein
VATSEVNTADYELTTETSEVQGLLSVDGIRFLFTSFVDNFRNFAAVAIILVVMIGVGLAEAAGLIGALIRKLVAVSSSSTLTFIIVLLGMVSSVASDAGYLVLIPLGAVAFKSVGRNPLAGIAAAFAGVAAGFGVNFLITPLDGVLTEITNDASALAAPDAEIDLVANLYFGIVSALFVTIVLTLVTARLVEGRIGPYDPADAGEQPEEPDDVDPAGEARGLRLALWATLGVLLVIALLTVIPGAPLRHPETGRIIGDSPLMDSLIVIIALIFLVAGLAYGHGAGTLKGSEQVLASISKSWAGMASLLFLFLLIAQFLAYFDYSNMAQIAAVQLGDVLEEMDIGAVWLLIGFILVTLVVDLIMPAAIAKWAILAPIFIPLLIRLDVTPQTVLAAYRVADSPLNVVTPLMAYFPLIVVFVRRYQKSAGIGTVVSLMLPYVVFLTVAWTLFFLAWYLIGIPLGPGSPVHAD